MRVPKDVVLIAISLLRPLFCVDHRTRDVERPTQYEHHIGNRLRVVLLDHEGSEEDSWRRGDSSDDERDSQYFSTTLAIVDHFRIEANTECDEAARIDQAEPQIAPESQLFTVHAVVHGWRC